MERRVAAAKAVVVMVALVAMGRLREQGKEASFVPIDNSMKTVVLQVKMVTLAQHQLVYQFSSILSESRHIAENHWLTRQVCCCYLRFLSFKWDSICFIIIYWVKNWNFWVQFYRYLFLQNNFLILRHTEVAICSLLVGFVWHGTSYSFSFSFKKLYNYSLVLDSDIYIFALISLNFSFFYCRYPIYRIPTGPTLKDVDACFLTYHLLATPSSTSLNILRFYK